MIPTPLPDVTALVVAHLRADSGVTDAVAQRVYSRIPDEPQFPLVTVQRAGGGRARMPWLDVARVQVDVWGAHNAPGQRELTHAIASAVQYAMMLLPRGRVDEGVVTHASMDTLAWVPEQTGQARHMLLFTVRLHR